MTTKVNLPKAGMGIEEGTVVRWLKTEGDLVAKGEIVAEVETAKAIQEVVAPVGGRLRQILVAEGATTPVNTALAVIDEESD
jgi:pyruvate/2-oxoglutarate dehydrogenase complex dihydrolipoamide acyltransferase (E2) component